MTNTQASPASNRSRRHSAVSTTKEIARDPGLLSLQRIVGMLRSLNVEMPLQQAAVLFTVAGHLGVTAGEIQADLCMSQASTSRCIAALSRRHRLGVPGLELVEQRPDPRDSRRLFVYLSAKGDALMSQLLQLMRNGANAPDLEMPPYAASSRLRGLSVR